MGAHVNMPETLKNLLRSEIEQAIYQANLGKIDTGIAQRYLIEQIPQIDIAAEYGCERSTISRRLPRIIDKVESTAQKMCIRDSSMSMASQYITTMTMC